jgi:hypothetical protein
LHHSGRRKLRKKSSLFVGKEDIQPGLGERTLDFFTSLCQIISRSSYIGANIIMMVSTFCLLSPHNHNKVILCQSHQTVIIVAMPCFGVSLQRTILSHPGFIVNM